MLNLYVVLSTIVLIILAYIWSNNTWLNMSIKTVLFMLGGFGLFTLAVLSGYVVKVN